MRTGPEPRTGVAASPDAAQHAKAIGHLLARIDQTAAQIGDLFPLSADPQTGTWMTAPDGRWTGGFWCGQLWLALQASGDAKYRVLAENALQRLQGRLESDNVLNGLVFYYAAALGKQLHQSQAGAALGALGAEALARRFNPGAGFIPLGHDSGSLSADSALPSSRMRLRSKRPPSRPSSSSSKRCFSSRCRSSRSRRYW